jgi:hypothetical protein
MEPWHIYGVVPNEVRTVRLQMYHHLPDRTATVTNNFYDVKFPPNSFPNVKTVTWLDAAGHVIRR